jgi:hypothetical protein
MILMAGCVTNQKIQSPAPAVTQTQVPAVQSTPTREAVVQTGTIPVQSPVATQVQVPAPRETVVQTETIPVTSPVGSQAQVPVPLETAVPPVQVVRASDMNSFISSSFPEVTDLYEEVKKSKNALEWKAVQDRSLELQILIQNLKKTYNLNTPNPEKNVFPGLDSKQEIVFLKYIRYLDDMENYATNLKNAIYYQERGSDPQSAQTSRRYQGLADQYEKQAIAGVKTISDYCRDFKYTFFDDDSVQQYRYTG